MAVRLDHQMQKALLGYENGRSKLERLCLC